MCRSATPDEQFYDLTPPHLMPIQTFVEEPTPQDWQRFYRINNYITELHSDGDGTMSDDLWYDLRARPNPQQRLLPNARRAHIETIGILEDLQRILSLLPRTLLKLEWSPHDPPLAFPGDGVLGTLATRFPHLAHLTIDSIPLCDVKDFPGLVKTLPKLRNLRTLVLGGINVTRKLANAMMAIGSLTQLELRTFGHQSPLGGFAPPCGPPFKEPSRPSEYRSQVQGTTSLQR